MRCGAIKFEAPSNVDRELPADLFMASAGHGFAGIVQQEGQMQDKRPFDGLKYLGVFVERRVSRAPNAIDLLDAHERVLIRCILMVELMLDETGELAEFWNVFAQQPHLVHPAKNTGDISALIEDLQKRFAHMLVAEKTAVDQRQFAANELRKVGVQFQVALLRM